MAKVFDSIDMVAQNVGAGGNFHPDTQYKTIGNLVDALIEMGNDEKVLVSHDDHLGLKLHLSPEFLNAPLEDAKDEKFEAEVELVLAQANAIIPLYDRDLSDDDMEEIREDKISRGVKTED